MAPRESATGDEVTGRGVRVIGSILSQDFGALRMRGGPQAPTHAALGQEDAVEAVVDGGLRVVAKVQGLEGLGVLDEDVHADGGG